MHQPTTLDAPENTAAAPDAEPVSMLKHLGNLTFDLVRMALIAVLCTTFVIQPVEVQGTSMLPVLHDGERILINKYSYWLDGWPSPNLSIGHPVERGDVVVFYYPNDPNVRFVKRVIGVPGDLVQIDSTGHVLVNGKQLDEPYLSPQYTRMPEPMGATRVSDHYFFVMGDNRDNSSDSRSWGLVPEKYICGKAVFRLWPLSDIGLIGD